MRPGHTRARGRRVDPVAVVELPYRRVGECGGRAAADAAIGAGGGKQRRTWPETMSIQAPRVVVRGVLGKHQAEVALAEDQHAVGDFAADGQHDAFGEAVRPRTARGNLFYRDVRICEHRVERRTELSGPVPDDEPEPSSTFGDVHDEVTLTGRGPAGTPRRSNCSPTTWPSSSAGHHRREISQPTP